MILIFCCFFKSFWKVVFTYQSVLQLIKHVFLISTHGLIQLSPVINLTFFRFEFSLIHLLTNFVNKVNSSIPNFLLRVFWERSIANFLHFVLNLSKFCFIFLQSSLSITIKLLRHLSSWLFELIVFVYLWSWRLFWNDLR